MKEKRDDVDLLRCALADEPELELAVLIGSRAGARSGPESDWDIAIQWKRDIDRFQILGSTECLRRRLAARLCVTEDRIDLIDIPSARLAMRAVVAEEGVPLKGEDSLAWSHFLRRTWRDLEDYHWESIHAA